MTHPLRVAVVAGAYSGVLDGVTLTTNRQVRYLLDHGIPTRVYAPTEPARALEPAGDVVRVPSLPFPNTAYRVALGLPARVRRDLERFRPTLVHLASPDWLGAAVRTWAARRRVPVVATYHTHYPRYLRHYGVGLLEPLAWRYLRWFYAGCREVYVPAASTAADLRAHGLAGNLVPMPYGVDTARFRPDRRSAAWRQRHGIADDLPVLLFVGRLVWEKGLAEWAKVSRMLTAEGVRHAAVIVGDGPAGDELKRDLPAAVFTGRLTGDELAAAFASADVFLFPSASETFGCVTLEAMASGLPVVAADATGSRDIVRHETDGLLVPPGDVPAFAAAVRRLLADPALRARLGAAAAERAGGFGWAAVLGGMAERFRQVGDVLASRAA